MTLDQIREKLVAQLHNNWGGATPVFYENAEEVDLANVGDYFVKFEIEFNGSTQANIGPTPFDRTHGTLVLTVFGKKTLGTKQVNTHLETLKSLYKFKNLGGVHTQAAGPGDGHAADGWFSRSLRVPFYADSNA